MVFSISSISATAQTDDVEARPQITVSDDDIGPEDKVMWSADNVYVLDGAVFVEDGAELHIPEGTVIKANDGTGVNASTLVITRGGKIFANGTKDKPIIFTSVQDNISSLDFLNYESRGLWGGIVILGRARTNNPGDASGDYKEIEGVNEIVAEGDTRAEYGGDDDEDSSGVMLYVSIRHTGINIGESDGNEIQGLTLGGVGSGTVLEYIESYSSGDDGVEFFGGTANLKYFISAFNSDDAVDWDQGWRGKGQFWFVLQGTDKAGAAAEQDGAGGDEHFAPFAEPEVYNATYVGPGVGNKPASDRAEMLMFRDNTGGHYRNSIFTDFESNKGGYALHIEDVDNTGAKTEDSRKRFEEEDLTLSNNIWWSFGSGASLQDWVRHDGDFRTQILAALAASNNMAVDPMLRGIERDTEPSMELDPRPASNSPAFTAERSPYTDEYFEDVDFIGAFGATNWGLGWSALDHLGYFSSAGVTDVEDYDELIDNGSVTLLPNYPNPFNHTSTLQFSVQDGQHVKLGVYDLSGRLVTILLDSYQTPGRHSVEFDARGLAPGHYVYKLESGSGNVSRQMTVTQ